MANQQLVDFIKAALAQNQTQDQMRQSLLQSGWQEGDIVEAFSVAISGSTVVPVAPIKYAGFWIRWAAAMLDGLIVTAASFIINILFGIILVIFSVKIEESPFRFLGYIIGWGYLIFMVYKYEATFGKKLVGIKVVSDKSERLTLGQVILRETVGKIVSSMTLMIGYIMAGFTERKQALHDKIASTTVVYKDPNKKVAVWVIIIALIFPLIAIIGILASIVLVSLNTARSKARDAFARASLNSIVTEAIIYYDNQNSFLGFKAVAKPSSCNNEPIVNISQDGQEVAILEKSCSDKEKYFCVDANGKSSGIVKEINSKDIKTDQTNCL